jgi:hypothetical protein
MVIVEAAGPSWVDAVTALGTVGAVVAAVWIALRAERRSDKRVGEEREFSGRVLAEQRALDQAAIEDERSHGRAQLEEERRLAREREQLSEAYRVQVVLGERWGASVKHNERGGPGAAETKVLAVMVSNSGSYTITRVEAQFCIGISMRQPHRHEGFANAAILPDAVLGDFRPAPELPLQGVLTPADWGIRFETDEIHVKYLVGPYYAVVRWTDEWGTRWEHKQGVVRRISEDEQWAP